jgi:predicted PurR-regulated permease PerM
MLSWTILLIVTGLSGETNVRFLEFNSPWAAAAATVAGYLIFDRAFDLFVFPKVVGRSVGLNPIVSLFVVFSGGALFGLMGMLLAFPLAGAVKVVLDRLIRVTSTGSGEVYLPAVPLRHRGDS